MLSKKSDARAVGPGASRRTKTFSIVAPAVVARIDLGLCSNVVAARNPRTRANGAIAQFLERSGDGLFLLDLPVRVMLLVQV